MKKNSPDETSSVQEKRSGSLRGWWFPLLLLAVVVLSWLWIWQSDLTRDYRNVFRVFILVPAVGLLSVWYLFFGGLRLRTRGVIVALPWLLLVGFLWRYQPIYNGDLGIVGWRLRHIPDVDEMLQEIAIQNLPADKQDSQGLSTLQDYPRFLGNGYWAEVEGVQLETDWKKHPPEEIWRHDIGAGWSAFAIVGDLAITQEQRGKQELVVCYHVLTGEPLWTHADVARFDPATVQAGFGGIGPRATPTIHGHRVITHGATGIINCLDVRTGKLHWSHDGVEELGGAMLTWGNSGSPLVVEDEEFVVINVGAPIEEGEEGAEPQGNSLVAFDLETGDVRWAAGNRGTSYASPVLANLASERQQILQLNDAFLTSHDASDGHVLWEHPWPGASNSNPACSQPVPLPGDRVFLSKGYGTGASLLQIDRTDEGEYDTHPLWNPAVRPLMRTKMGNVVVRDGHIYGLDGGLLQCIEIETGDSQWKKRRRPAFGHGQILLIGNVILILSEEGELALVECNPKRYRELARFQALDAEHVTWNNPAFAPPYLLVRNGREAVCFRLRVESNNPERGGPRSAQGEANVSTANIRVTLGNKSN